MDLIITALTAGAIAATKDTAGTAIKDAYQGLKKLIKKKFENFESEQKATAQMVLEEHEKYPQTYKAPLEQKLAEVGVDKDEEIIQAAQDVMKIQDPEGFKKGDYNIRVQGNVYGVVGSSVGPITMKFGDSNDK